MRIEFIPVIVIFLWASSLICFAIFRTLQERCRSHQTCQQDKRNRALVAVTDAAGFEHRHNWTLPYRLISMYEDPQLLTSRHIYCVPPNTSEASDGWYIWTFRRLDEHSLDEFPPHFFQREFPFASDLRGNFYSVLGGQESAFDAPVYYSDGDPSHHESRIKVCDSLDEFLSWKRIQYFPPNPEATATTNVILLRDQDESEWNWRRCYWLDIETGDVRRSNFWSSYRDIVRFAGGYASNVEAGFKEILVALYTDGKRLFLRIADQVFDLSDADTRITWISKEGYLGSTNESRFSIDRGKRSLFDLKYFYWVDDDFFAPPQQDVLERVFKDTGTPQARDRTFRYWKNKLHGFWR